MKIRECVVVGDSVWDLLSAQRARALGVGLLAGGNGREELERAAAYRVIGLPFTFTVWKHDSSRLAILVVSLNPS